MSDKAAKIIIPIALTFITAASYFLKDTFHFLYDALKNIFSFEFSEKRNKFDLILRTKISGIEK